MGFGSNVYLCNALVDMYVRFGCLSSARQVFDEMPGRDVVSWTSLMSGYVQVGNVSESSRLFNEMRWASAEPSSVTLAVILRVCGIKKDGEGVRQVYCFAIKRGYESYELVQNSILTTFSKVGCFVDVEKLFSSIPKSSIVSWNILMSGYALRGSPSKVIGCFETLMCELEPTHETLTLVISAFAKLRNLLQGQKLHGLAVKSGQIDMVLEASLVDFYAKCGELALSVLLFEDVKTKNNSVWSVMIWGFIQNGQFTDAISLFRSMQDFGYELTADTLRGLVLACTELGALLFGKSVHGYLMRNIFCDNFNLETLGTSILNMYAKCGNIVLAHRCFDRMAHKDVVAWSSMIEGYAIHGFGSKALELFYQMQAEGMKPNSITFLSLLSACSHSGLMIEGCEVFNSMSRKFGVQPELYHYTCMVDLLGRCGKLYEALEVINNMNSKPDARIWGALLASSRIHSDNMLGNYAAQMLFNLEPDNVGYHVVLSNIQVSEGKWDNAERIRKDMKKQDFIKKPGWSCIEEKGRFYVFVAADTSHPQADEIYRILVCLTWQTEEIETDGEMCPHELSIGNGP